MTGNDPKGALDEDDLLTEEVLRADPAAGGYDRRDEATATCQRYLCKNRTTAVTGVVTKRGEVWIISTCDEHNPLTDMPATEADLRVHIIGAIRAGAASRTGFYFSHRYTSDAPSGEAALWAMSDGTVRWRNDESTSVGDTVKEARS